MPASRRPSVTNLTPQSCDIPTSQPQTTATGDPAAGAAKRKASAAALQVPEKKKKKRRGKRARDGSPTTTQSHPHPHPPTPTMPAMPAESPEVWRSPTGTLLTFQNSGHHLSRWFQSIGHNPAYEPSDVLPANYTPPLPSKRAAKAAALGQAPAPGPIQPQGSLRICIVNLHGLHKVSCAIPPEGGWTNKTLARQSASFEAVKELHRLGEIGDGFEPTPSNPREKAADDSSSTKSRCCVQWEARKAVIRSRLPVIEAKEDGTFKGTGIYPFQTNPGFWRECPRLDEGELYICTLQLSVKADGVHDPECRVLGLVTGKPLPFWEAGRKEIEIVMNVGDQPMRRASMRLVNGGKMKKWEEGRLVQTFNFTEKLLRAEAQRLLTGQLDKVKWVLVPMRRGYAVPSKDELASGEAKKFRRKDIAWDDIETVSDGPLAVPFDLHTPGILEQQCQDGMATSPAELTRRSYIHKLRFDFNPSSPHPTRPNHTIFSSLRLENSATPPAEYTLQPVLETTPVTVPKHGGHVYAAFIPTPPTFLLPELEHRHAIPASVFRAASVFPHFMFNLENMLIAHEMASTLFPEASFDPTFALQAITAGESVNDPERTYERLEILGDTLLKLIVTLHFYIAGGGSKATEDMQKTLEDRHVVCSNRTLLAHAVRTGLDKFVRTKRFKVKDWVPKDWELDTPLNGAPPNRPVRTSYDGLEERKLGDKVLADVVEAVIGASYLPDKNLDNVIATMRALGIPITLFKNWDEVTHAMPAPKANAKKGEDAFYMKFFKTPAVKVMGYTFSDEERRAEVFSLSSSPERRIAVERYRILGNAVLDYYILEVLAEKYPKAGPAQLSYMKTARSSEGVRCAIAVEGGLTDLMFQDGDEQTRKEIKKVKNALIAAKAQADKGLSEHEQGGEHYWEDIPISHAIGDLVECFIGAVLHDSSFSLAPSRTIFDIHIAPFLEKYCRGPIGFDPHPKARLTRWMQRKGCAFWTLDVVDSKQMEERELRRANGRGRGGVEEEGEEGEAVVAVHGHEIARERAPTTLIAIRKTCEMAYTRLNDEAQLEKLCNCPSLKKHIAEEGGKL
ncbi:hypothetical protein IAT38_007734 [Cryptococcus sp. DSM 104549]